MRNAQLGLPNPGLDIYFYGYIFLFVFPLIGEKEKSFEVSSNELGKNCTVFHSPLFILFKIVSGGLNSFHNGLLSGIGMILSSEVRWRCILTFPDRYDNKHWLVAHISMLLLAPFDSKLVNESRLSETLNLRITEEFEIDVIFLRKQRFYHFQTFFRLTVPPNIDLF